MPYMISGEGVVGHLVSYTVHEYADGTVEVLFLTDRGHIVAEKIQPFLIEALREQEVTRFGLTFDMTERAVPQASPERAFEMLKLRLKEHPQAGELERWSALRRASAAGPGRDGRGQRPSFWHRFFPDVRIFWWI